MRWMIALLVSLLVCSANTHAAEGKVYKVLPQFLDLKGRASLSPSLYDRDAYQDKLRRKPAERSGYCFQIQWKAKVPETEPLKLKVEIRGIAEGDVPKEITLELPVRQRHWYSHWAKITLGGNDYKTFGEVTAWRVTLWDGDQLLSEQKSFLW
jgi:hypothetical protein